MCVFCLYCNVWNCKCACMESVSVSSYRCCMLVPCVHPGQFSMLYDLQFVNAWKRYTRESVS